MQFLRFVAVRVLQALLVVWAVVTVVFVVSRVIGHPENALVPIDATEDQLEEMRRFLGVGRPIIDQYGDFVSNAAQLDFGYSYARRKPAIDLVAARLWPTMKLGLAALAFALAIGASVGLVSALHRRSMAAWFVRLFVLMGQGVPSFWMGLILISVFAVDLGWFPTGGTTGSRRSSCQRSRWAP